MLLRFIRRYSNRSLDNVELSTLLQKSTWKMESLLENQKRIPEISRPVLLKLLKLSGIETTLTKERELFFLQSLKSQMGFIDHLYEETELRNDDEPVNNFRLIASDHQKVNPLNLESLKRQINELQASDVKGETGNWNVVENSNKNGQNNNSGYFCLKGKP